MAEKAIISASPFRCKGAPKIPHEAGTQDREEKPQVTHTILEEQLEDRPPKPELKHMLWHLTAVLFLLH